MYNSYLQYNYTIYFYVFKIGSDILKYLYI